MEKRMHCLRVLATWSCLLLPAASVVADDLSELLAKLDSEAYAEREWAERQLVHAGSTIVARILDDATLPADRTDAQAAAHFDKVTGELRSALDEKIYRRLNSLDGLEASYRARRIRRLVEQEAEMQLRRAQAGFPQRLPPTEASKMHGYTGGFREGTTWFDAHFGNNSSYLVTSIRILVRITHKRTGEKTERELDFSDPGAPLRPGESVNWSADVGFARSRDHEFFWDTLAVFGALPVPDDTEPGGAVLLETPNR
jgi:hypothetical protein